jgi:UDP-glucose 4-epimerase
MTVAPEAGAGAKLSRGNGRGCRVLVTGGTGFIGVHLCRALLQVGAEVEVWSRSGSTAARALAAEFPTLEVHAIDVRRRPEVASALAARPPNRVFHLAGIRLMGNRADNLVEMFETHVQGALHVIEAVPADARVVVVGSCEEYGRGPVPFRETQVAQPQTAYSISRLATTLACLALPVPSICVARLAVVYGAGQVGDMFIPSLLEACAARRPFAMTTGEQTRDFLYVEDAVRALLALADTEAATQELVNVGTGVERTVRQVAEQAAQLSGHGTDLRIGAIPSRPGEASRYACAIDKIQSLTGWQPTIDLEEGLARTLEWWRQRSPRR